ncbi:MAG: DUF924 domain-containing protein, partial [Betaproteobacteria bacterium]
MQTELVDELHASWFGSALNDPTAARAQAKVWFGHDPAFDAVLAARFGDLPPRVLAGGFDQCVQAPRQALARILALDQLPRNIFRNTPRAYAFDAGAVAAASAALASGHDRELHPLEAAFVYLPFEHAEDLDMQVRAVELFEGLRVRAPHVLQDLFASFADFAHRHHGVILRFGRFPHRNDTLGRASTPEERAYLASGGEHFGARPRGQKPTLPPA